MTVDPGYLRCFSCGGQMLPWWNTELPVPHGDDPIRQWHPLCFGRWLAYMAGWRIMARTGRAYPEGDGV